MYKAGKGLERVIWSISGVDGSYFGKLEKHLVYHIISLYIMWYNLLPDLIYLFARINVSRISLILTTVPLSSKQHALLFIPALHLLLKTAKGNPKNTLTA